MKVIISENYTCVALGYSHEYLKVKIYSSCINSHYFLAKYRFGIIRNHILGSLDMFLIELFYAICRYYRYFQVQL